MTAKVPALSPAGNWKADRKILGKILQYGLPSALQQAIQPIGKVLIQGQVNALGVSSIAAFNAVTRVDDFACIPEQGIGRRSRRMWRRTGARAKKTGSEWALERE